MGFYVAAIIIMMAVQWMSVDMYLPALPVLKEEFAASESLLNLSLNSDLVFCAVGTLIGGTLSDKYGRNSIMIIGLLMSAGAMFLGAAAPGVVVLIIARGLIGFGSGLALTVANAIVRDSFDGDTFQRVTTLAQAAAIAGPILAPALGAFFVEYLSWRWIFISLGIGTIVTLLPFAFAKETWPKERRIVTSVWGATTQAFSLVKDFNFTIFAVFMGIITIPLWGYIAVCSYVYYDIFNVSNIEYSILYAIGAVAGFIGPILYIKLSRITTGKHTLEVIMGMNLLTMVLMLTIAPLSPVLFMIACLPIIMTEAMSRSMGIVVVLEEYPQEAGAVSSVAGFVFLIVSIVGTTMGTLPWNSLIFGLAMTTAIMMVITIAIWIVIVKKKVFAEQLNR